MGKEKQALKPDVVVKNYWRNNEQFADFFNAVLFDGKQVIDNKDLFSLLGILLDRSRKPSETREKAIAYAREHEVEKSVIMTVAGAANCKIDYSVMERKGDADMCTVFEETRREGVEQGRIEGRIEGRTEGRTEGRIEGRAEEIIQTGYEFGLSEKDILTRLQKKLDVSAQKAQEYLAMFGRNN